jgi:hypothetical protein
MMLPSSKRLDIEQWPGLLSETRNLSFPTSPNLIARTRVVKLGKNRLQDIQKRSRIDPGWIMHDNHQRFQAVASIAETVSPVRRALTIIAGHSAACACCGPAIAVART